MPRDFVPCLYTERELPNIEIYGTVTRCEVIECFALHAVVTHTPGMLMTPDSHAYCRDAAPGDLEGTRHELFHTFYAAMAALE